MTSIRERETQRPIIDVKSPPQIDYDIDEEESKVSDVRIRQTRRPSRTISAEEISRLHEKLKDIDLDVFENNALLDFKDNLKKATDTDLYEEWNIIENKNYPEFGTKEKQSAFKESAKLELGNEILRREKENLKSKNHFERQKFVYNLVKDTKGYEEDVIPKFTKLQQNRINDLTGRDLDWLEDWYINNIINSIPKDVRNNLEKKEDKKLKKQEEFVNYINEAFKNIPALDKYTNLSQPEEEKQFTLLPHMVSQPPSVSTSISSRDRGRRSPRLIPQPQARVTHQIISQPPSVSTSISSRDRGRRSPRLIPQPQARVTHQIISQPPSVSTSISSRGRDRRSPRLIPQPQARVRRQIISPFSDISVDSTNTSSRSRGRRSPRLIPQPQARVIPPLIPQPQARVLIPQPQARFILPDVPELPEDFMAIFQPEQQAEIANRLNEIVNDQANMVAAEQYIRDIILSKRMDEKEKNQILKNLKQKLQPENIKTQHIIRRSFAINKSVVVHNYKNYSIIQVMKKVKPYELSDVAKFIVAEGGKLSLKGENIPYKNRKVLLKDLHHLMLYSSEKMKDYTNYYVTKRYVEFKLTHKARFAGSLLSSNSRIYRLIK